MKKLIFSVLLLTGCQTAGQLGHMSMSGMNGLSCDQIYAAFNAYKQDRNSVDAWVQMVEMINPELDVSAVANNTSAAERYEQALTYVNIGLAVQGCQPL
ncbi:hypothetical protein G8770_03265 [Aestuariicella hydrocarbonica]|uniref:Lipoprotein n=1 Tax=Pseudomaricurvus hydrocarbonicus TaxID=1470433 RepID=A0A9E5MLT0_9GAMM|nr:hypothetical protein [Aestuariicella hydrocarbonica]NHO64565.1 hypothetical protein [Aestuariicella hydrocarbonica]